MWSLDDYVANKRFIVGTEFPKNYHQYERLRTPLFCGNWFDFCSKYKRWRTNLFNLRFIVAKLSKI